MTELDELLSRLRKLEPIALDREFKASLQQRARSRRVRGARRAPLASFAVVAKQWSSIWVGRCVSPARCIPLSP